MKRKIKTKDQIQNLVNDELTEIGDMFDDHKEMCIYTWEEGEYKDCLGSVIYQLENALITLEHKLEIINKLNKEYDIATE